MQERDRLITHRYLSPQRLMAGMLLIATFLLALATRTLAAPLLVGSCVLLHTATGRPRLPRLRTFYALLWAVPYALWWRYGTTEGAGVGTRNSSFTMLSFMGYYTLTLGTHQLLSRGGGHLDYALACAVMALGLAGVGRTHAFFLPLTVAFGVMMLAYLRLEQVRRNGVRGKPVAWRYAAAIGVMVAVGGLIEGFFVPAVPHAGTWLITHLVPSNSIRGGGGFNRSVEIGNMPSLWGSGPQFRQVMLYVFTDRVSPYLRGAVYDTYTPGSGSMKAGTWNVGDPQSDTEKKNQDRSLDTTETHLGRNLFNTFDKKAGAASQSQEVVGVVYPSMRIADSYFLPLGVHQVGSFADKSLVGIGDCMRPEGFGGAGGYAYYAPTVKEQTDPTPQDLAIHRDLQEVILSLAKQATQDAGDDSQRIAMIEGWFRDNFEYQIGFTRQHESKDPVLEFLEDQRAAHCEYFASACVLMLRSLEIPARYVTGFVVEERGAGDDFWVARRRHAHAWVEAYIEREGWVTVEPTPPSGMPSVERGSAWDRRQDWLIAQWERFKQLVLTGGIFGVVIDTVVMLPQKAPMWVWLSLLTAGLAWMFRKNIFAWLRPEKAAPCDPRIAAMRQRLAAVERLLGHHGLSRPPAMTVASYMRAVRVSPTLPAELRDRAAVTLKQFADERYTDHMSKSGSSRT